MQIRKIKLKNFRNFKNCELNFSCDPDKKFTIILGQNTYGKTTLVKAFIWGLYRANTFDNKILLNSNEAYRMIPTNISTVSVEIELYHKQFLYKVITRETYCKNSTGDVYVRDKASSRIVRVDGDNSYTIVDPLKVNEEIDSILRSELKEYFFFDGENNSIESISKKKNLTDAVSNILGLASLEQLRDYFDKTRSDSVTKRFLNELIPSEKESVEDLQSKCDELLKENENDEEKVKEIDLQLEKLNKQINDYEGQLDANKDIAMDQEDKKRLEKEILAEKNTKEQKMQDLIRMINSSNALLKVLFGISFLKFKFDKLKEESSFKNNNSYRGITEQAVNDLIRSGKCICGAEIKTGNDAYNHLLTAREHMEPHDYGKYLSDFISAENSNACISSTTWDGIKNIAGEINDIISQIDDNEDRLKNIKNRIQGKADVGEIQSQIRQIERQIGQKENERKFIVNECIPNNTNKISSIQEKIKRSALENEQNEFTNLCLQYSETIYNLSSKKITESKDKIKNELKNEVSHIFSSMYHGNRGVRIDDNYRAVTYVINEDKDQQIDGSTGLITVLNYSFVAGLLNLAKKAILNNNDDTDDPELANETYPLVMDAPFSNTDEEHIINICNELPNYCDQIIMLVMQKDFNYAESTISNKIGKKYRLIQVSETETNVEEVI